jgi:hypothetical protein
MSIPAAQPGDICVIVEPSMPDTTGVWICQIPYTPETVWRALRDSTPT